MSSQTFESPPVHRYPVPRQDSRVAVPKQDTRAQTVGPSHSARQAFQDSLNRVAEKTTPDHLSAQYAPVAKPAVKPSESVAENLNATPSATEDDSEELDSELLLQASALEADSPKDSTQPLMTGLESPRQLESNGTASTTHALPQHGFLATTGVAGAALEIAANGHATTGLLTCDKLSAMLDRLDAVGKTSGLHSFELVDSTLGLKAVQIGTTGTAGWTIRLLTDRATRDQLRRQGSDLHASLSERGYRVASITVVGVNDAQKPME